MKFLFLFTFILFLTCCCNETKSLLDNYHECISYNTENLSNIINNSSYEVGHIGIKSQIIMFVSNSGYYYYNWIVDNNFFSVLYLGNKEDAILFVNTLLAQFNSLNLGDKVIFKLSNNINYVATVNFEDGKYLKIDGSIIRYPIYIYKQDIKFLKNYFNI